MTLTVLGTNHKTAKLELRERWSYATNEVTTTLKKIKDNLNTSEVVLLSTCNRTEIYCDIENPNTLINWFNKEVAPLTEIDLTQHGYIYHDIDAISHIMRVASGLDSLVMGEPQILGQFKQAYRLAQKAKTVGKNFDKLFNQIFCTAKNIRTNTEIGQHPVSVASSSVKILLKELSECNTNLNKTLSILLIGSGDTIKTVGKTIINSFAESKFKKLGIENINLDIASRNSVHAHDLAEYLKDYNNQYISTSYIQPNAGLNNLSITVNNFNNINNTDILKNHNVIFSATNSPVYLLNCLTIKEVIQKSQTSKSKLLLIDLAVPRDIDPLCRELDNVCLYTIDDLESIVTNNTAYRQKAAQAAEKIIEQDSRQFLAWQSSLTALASICAYREEAEKICEDIIAKSKRKLESGQDPEEVLVKAVNLLSKKLTHHPTITLKTLAQALSNPNDTIEAIHSK